MTSFENVVEIRRPREEVFAFLADLENVPRWNPAIEVTEKMSPGAVGIGTTYRQVRSVPKISEEEFEIVVFDPPRRLTIDGEIGTFRGRIGYTLEVTEAGTKLTKGWSSSRRRSSPACSSRWRRRRSSPRSRRTSIG